MVAIGNIFITTGKICEKSSKITSSLRLNKVFPTINNKFDSISSKVNNGISIAQNAREQRVILGKGQNNYFDNFLGKIKKSGIIAFAKLVTDRDFMLMLIKYGTLDPKRIIIPKSLTQLVQLLIEQTTGGTKLAQLMSCDKSIMAKIPFNSVKEALLNTKTNCFFSRTMPEAQQVIDNSFKKGTYIIQKELSSASIGDVYLARDIDGKQIILKLLKKGLSREKLELEEKIFLRIIKELSETPEEYTKYKKIISSCYSDFISSLSFATEKNNNKILAKKAKRYSVTPIINISDDGKCLVMEKAKGIQMNKLLAVLHKYRENPENFASRYAEEIAKNPWLANPERVINSLSDSIIKTFDEQFMFLKKGGKSVMHGDPHPGNFFITTNKKGHLIPEFIDTGSCVIRNENQILEDIKFFANYYLGNTKGIAEHFVKICDPSKGDKTKIIEKITKDFDEKIFNKRKITNMKLVLDNMFAILNAHGLKLPTENVIATKAQIQFYSLLLEIAKLSGKAVNVFTVIKDLPRAVIQMFIHGKNPIFPMLPTVKHSIKNIEKAVGTSYQFSLPNNKVL